MRADPQGECARDADQWKQAANLQVHPSVAHAQPAERADRRRHGGDRLREQCDERRRALGRLDGGRMQLAPEIEGRQSNGWRSTMVSSRPAPVEMRSIGTPTRVSIRSMKARAGNGRPARDRTPAVDAFQPGMSS